MKLSVIITTILVAQVSASFFDVFHGAVLSVQNSFGKLLSDVVTDVKETVDCTILAMEHVLYMSNDATTRYYEKCGSVTNQTDSVSETRQDRASAPKVELTFNLPNNSEYLLKMIPVEIDAKINETLSKVLGNNKSHDNILSIENVLAKQSEQLAGVTVLVKKDFDKLSHEVTTDLKEIEKQRDSEPVDTILQKIKVLEKRDQNTKNTSEASEIHQVIDQGLGKLDAIEATEADENIKLEVILKHLESNSNNSFVHLWQQFEEWKEEESRHISKIDEHEKMFDYPGSFNSHGFESPTTVGSSEVATLPTNQSKTLQNNLTRNKMNKSVTNATLGIINSAHVNKTIPPVDLLADLNKQESSSVTANEPTTVLSTNENNSNGTVIVSNPLQSPEITAIKDAMLPGKRNADSGKQETSDSAINNDTVIINAAETAEIEMTSTSQSNNNLNDTVISSTGNTMVENTSVNVTSSENVESSTSATSEVVPTLATFHVIASNDTILTSTLSYINFSTPVNVTIVPTESSTATVNDQSSTVTAEIISDDSNNTMLPSTSSPNLESTIISETIESKETTLASGKDQSITKLYDPIITSTSLPTVKNIPVSVSVKPEETDTTSDNEKSSTLTTKIFNDNDSNNTIITTVSLPIVETTSVSGTVEPKETATVSGNEGFSKDLIGTMITSTFLPIIESTLIHKTIQPDETTSASSNKQEFSTETTLQLTTTSKIVNENDSDTTITSTPNPIISTSESETIQAIDITTVSTSDEESLGSTANSPTGTPNAAGDDDDSSSAVVTMTPEAIPESIPQKNVTAAVNDETSASSTNSPIASPVTLIDTDSNTDVITSTAFPSAEITTVREVIEPVKSTAPTENIEPSVLSTTPVTILDEVTNENTDTIDTVTTTTKNSESAVVHEKMFDYPGSFNSHGFESPTTVGSSEVATLPTNQSKTLQNNLTRNNMNKSVTNATLGIINSAHVNNTIPPVDLLADLNKQESSSVTANEPTTVLSTNENNSNGTVIVSNPLQPPEITAIKDVMLPGKRNTDSGKQETSDSAINNDTVIINAAETAGIVMTSTSQSNNNLNDTVISSTGNTMVENTSVNATSSENVESSTSATSEVVPTLATFHVIASNDTILTSTLSYINFSTLVNVTIVPTESSTATVNDQSSTVTAEIISDDSNNTMLPSTSSPNLESTIISETIESKETTLASGKDQSITKLYDPIITSTSLPTVKNIPVSVSVKPEETDTTSDNEKSSTLTTKIFNDNDSNNTIITTVSLPIVETTSVSGTVKPKETATVSGNEDFSKDLIGTMITSTSLPIIESTLINKTIQPEETTSASSNKQEFSTETTSQLTTTSKIVNENDSDTTITSTPNPIISTSESETIQAIDITTVSTSDEESLGSTANSPTGTPNAAGDDDDSSAAMVTMTPEAISESIPQKNVTAAENDETSTSSTNSPIASPVTLIDPDSNTDVITSTAFPLAEITTVREVIEPVKSTAPTENIEPSVSSTTPVTILDEVTNENTDTIDTVTTTTKNSESAVVTKIIQTDEISTASEEQKLSSTSTTTQSAIIMTTSTVFPPTESKHTSRIITASGNEEDLKNSPTIEANTSRTPEILNSPDLDVRCPALTITESVPVNREWLTTNTPKQKNYNTNETPRNNYEYNAPISLSDPLLQTGQPLIDPEVPMYGQAVPPITRGLFNGAPKLLTPDRLIPNAPNQRPKILNVELQQAAFELFDTADKQSSHRTSDSPFGPEEIKKIANIPSPPLITDTPRNPIDPQRMDYEDPSYVPTPKNPIVPPYSFDNRAPASTYKPQGLTTERPKITAARATKNSEAHQRALKDARQLIANSKRAERIINNIMKNRNKFNARSVIG